MFQPKIEIFAAQRVQRLAVVRAFRHIRFPTCRCCLLRREITRLAFVLPHRILGIFRLLPGP